MILPATVTSMNYLLNCFYDHLKTLKLTSLIFHITSKESMFQFYRFVKNCFETTVK